MAVDFDGNRITEFDQWYDERTEDERSGCLRAKGFSKTASAIYNRYTHYKREMDARVENYWKLEKLADGQVISEKPDLPNVSSGETAGLVRRIARNLVQHTPNVEVVCQFDDDSLNGVIAKYILDSKIIGDYQYTNDMQQNLFASVKTSFTLGFASVIPALLQKADGSWYIKYDTIHYRDVFPEPGAKDVREATEVFVRRYLTKGEILQIIRDQVEGWDIAALKRLLLDFPHHQNREWQSVSHQDKKRHMNAEGYEIITRYSSGGEPFVTFCGKTKMLFRIEQNLHPLKEHPVMFLVLEKDDQQPLGKSQVELILGRQEFQDLMHNGAMKLWYRNINPSIIGYGTVNSIPNLSPGKYTQISNPNARLEAFEVNTQTLMQYGTIAQQNLGSMVNLVGAADQQMAVQAGNGMSATPQGVEAQQAMVDITTNNYQKAIESFFSHYCSYSLMIYFQELKGVKKLTPSADARQKLINAGQQEVIDEATGKVTIVNAVAEAFEEDGSITFDFNDMAIEYWVRCVPGSLVEMEDEKQLRILNELFVPLSQAMPAIAQTQDEQLIRNVAATFQYIVEKEIELSGSNRSSDLKALMKTGRTEQFNQWQNRADQYEQEINGVAASAVAGLEQSTQVIQQLQEQMRLMQQTQALILQKLGVGTEQSASAVNNSQPAPAPVS